MELGRARRSTVALPSPLEDVVDIDQPALGRIGVDSFSLTLDHHWEGGWTLVTSSRLSGSQTWRQHRYEALSDDEALEMVQMVSAELLGLL